MENSEIINKLMEVCSNMLKIILSDSESQLLNENSIQRNILSEISFTFANVLPTCGVTILLKSKESRRLLNGK